MKRMKKFLVASLILNGVLIIGVIGLLILPAVLFREADIAIYNSLQTRMCGERYNELVTEIKNQGFDEETTAQRLNAFAISLCFRNYKTGEDLDLKPLLKQVNETPPKTNIK